MVISCYIMSYPPINPTVSYCSYLCTKLVIFFITGGQLVSSQQKFHRFFFPKGRFEATRYDGCLWMVLDDFGTIYIYQ
jgi:hypothetical protein